MSNPPFADLIRRISAQGVLRSAIIAKRVGIAPSDLECLDLLQLDGPMTPGAIMAQTGLSSGAVTAMCDRLAKCAFVTRERDPADGRRSIVRITPEAVRSIAPFYAEVDVQWDRLRSDFTDDELAMVEQFLGAVLEQMRALTHRLTE